MSPPRHYGIVHESRTRSLFCAVVSSWTQTNAEESWFLKLPYLGFRGSSPQTVVFTFSSHDSLCPTLSHMLWECTEMLGTGPNLHDSVEKDSSLLSAGSFETTSGWQSSNAAVLFGITRRDGYRADVVYLVFWFLIILLYHEGYNLEGGLIQSSFILFILFILFI